jgi:exosome complex RNA-binding protein Rrp4
VIEVVQQRWKVDTNARQDAILALSSVNLPGGVQVRGRLHLMKTLKADLYGDSLAKKSGDGRSEDERIFG